MLDDETGLNTGVSFDQELEHRAALPEWASPPPGDWHIGSISADAIVWRADASERVVYQFNDERGYVDADAFEHANLVGVADPSFEISHRESKVAQEIAAKAIEDSLHNYLALGRLRRELRWKVPFVGACAGIVATLVGHFWR